MSEQTSVAFIICTHNNRAIIDECLDSILRQGVEPSAILVVDDVSTDGTADWIERSHPGVRVLRNPTNMGPAWGRNRAARESQSEYLAFIDSDVELDDHWLAPLVELLEADATVGIASGKIFYASRRDRLHAYGGGMGRIGIGWNQYDGEEDVGLTQPIETLWVSSASCLVRRRVFEEMGGFDDAYFYGYEDSDLGWRAAIAGHRAVSLPQARAYHRVSETIDRLGDRIVYHYHKNRFRSLLKNASFRTLLTALPLWGAYSLADLVARSQRGPKLKALWWNAWHLAETLDLRRKTQRARKRTDSELQPLFSRRLWPKRTLAARRREGARDRVVVT